VPTPGEPVKQIARRVLWLCADADRIGEQAAADVGVDDDRLFLLVEARDVVLTDLATQIAFLKQKRREADGRGFAPTGQVVNEANTLITEVCEALSASHRATMVLAERVAERVAELREELATVQRAGSAGLGYAALDTSPHVDRVR
jgi:hypothetical protein